MKIECSVCKKSEEFPDGTEWPKGWFRHAKDVEWKVPTCSEECLVNGMPALYATENDPFEAAKLLAETKGTVQ